MTDDEQAECELLQLAGTGGVFAIEVGLIFPQTTQLALERLQRRDWIALMPSTISTDPHARRLRIFVAFPVAMEWFRMQR